MPRRFFNFFPEQPDIRSQVLEFLTVFKTPHCAQEFGVVQRHVGILHKVAKQTEFDRRQVNFDTRLAQDSVLGIQLQIARRENGFLNIVVTAGGASG